MEVVVGEVVLVTAPVGLDDAEVAVAAALSEVITSGDVDRFSPDDFGPLFPMDRMVRQVHGARCSHWLSWMKCPRFRSAGMGLGVRPGRPTRWKPSSSTAKKAVSVSPSASSTLLMDRPGGCRCRQSRAEWPFLPHSQHKRSSGATFGFVQRPGCASPQFGHFRGGVLPAVPVFVAARGPWLGLPLGPWCA